MRFPNKQYIAGTAFIVVVVLVVWGLIAYRKAVQTAHAFAFANDLIAFSETHGHLPTSIQEFCEWSRPANGRPVWDVDGTTKRVRFLWLSPDFSVSSNSRFLDILDPSIKKYETALNEQIVGRISSNVLNTAIEPSKIKR